MKKSLILSTIFLSSLLAEDNNFQDFTSILQEASEVVTEKSFNVDYLPSVVTVIDAQTFLDAGLLNIGEALSMLPGIQMQMNYLGQPRTTIRGFNNPNSFISDKVKVLVDGVAINNEAAGTAGFYMDFPLDLVERIEVLRGPGSTQYGAGAIYGAVNIITKTGNKTDESSFYWMLGSYTTATTGGNFHIKADDFDIYTDAYYAQNEKGIFDEKAKGGNGATTDEKKEDLSVGITITNNHFEFTNRYKSSHYGNFYLYKGELYPNQDKGHKDDYFLSQLTYTKELNGYKLRTSLGYSYRESDATAYAYNGVIPALNNLQGFYIRDHQVEQNVNFDAMLELPKIAANDIKISVGTRHIFMSTNDFSSSVEDFINSDQTISDTIKLYGGKFDATSQLAYWQDPTSNNLYSKTSRTISYANLEDLISLSSKTDIVLGMRVDYYSDVGTHFSSRAGIVFRAKENLIMKLLYGSAFRAPTFTERYSKGHIYYRAGDADLKEETVDTLEAQFIYKPDLSNRFSLNLFYSVLKDVIDIEELYDTPEGYQNMKNRTSRGVEFEYNLKLNTTHDLYLNASYVDADYTVPQDQDRITRVITPEIDQSMPDVSKYMFKGLYVYSPISPLSFGTAWQYHNETTPTQLPWIVEDGYALPVKEYHLLDETITYRFSAASQLRLSIKNLLDEEVRLPGYYTNQPGGVLREGRSYYLTYKYTF
ncbi:MAG: TonB-dependent receptor [Campylobacterales bacterium]|nr:TonB-dependent receptor [Campylobacterales bacterium]